MLTNGSVEAESAAVLLLVAYEAAKDIDLPQNVRNTLQFAAFVAKRMLPDEESRQQALRRFLLDLANAIPI